MALLGYLALAVVFTFPLASNFATAIPGDGYDGLQNYWNLWWVRHALLDLNTSPFFTPELYYPTGTSLLFHTLNVLNGLWSLPVQLLSNLAITYNTVVLFTFALSGYGVFLLARRVLSGTPRASANESRTTIATVAGSLPAFATPFVAGIIFAFAPIRMAHLLGHMQVISTEWLPFFALTFLRLYDRGLSTRRIVLPALFLVFNALCDWYFVLYALIFAALVVLWSLRRRPAESVQDTLTGRSTEVDGWRSAVRRPWAVVAPLVLVLGCFMLVLAPLLAPMLTEAASAPYLRPPFEETVLLSADLVAFITPSEFHPLWGEAARTLAERFTSSTSERTVFLGFTPLALALLGWWRARNGGLAARSHTYRGAHFWLLLGLVYFLLALGPYLHVLGQVVAPIPLPYAWLYALIPLVRIARSVSRFDIMLMLAVSVLAAFGLNTLRSRTGMLCALLILFEFLAIPYPLTSIQVPPFYSRLRNESGSFALLELPINFDRPDPLLYQTVHAHPLLTAYTSRSNPLSLVERTPVLDELRTLQPDIIHYDTHAQAASVLADLGVRYVVNHPLTMGAGAERTVTNRILLQAFGDLQPLVNEPNLVVYRVPAPQPYRPYLSLGAGWGDVTFSEGNPRRAVEQQAELIIHVRDNLVRILHLNLHAQARSARVTLSQRAGPDETRILGEAQADPLASVDVLVGGRAPLLISGTAPLVVDSLELGDVVAMAR